ncbi:MAG TPA: TIGR00153 family protein [Planctomycetota bacterium]|nr:TIGR00153 family protein [Planctomycetota bacterium]
MSLIGELFGKSPFGPLVEHAKKVNECVKLVRPLLEACVREDWEGIHRLQDAVTKLEYEADVVKHEIRDHLTRRYFLPVAREDLDRYLHSQDEIADSAQDFAVVLILRNTKIHPELVQEFSDFVDQIVLVSETLTNAAQEMDLLAETSFGGAEADSVLKKISGLGEGEWKADRMQRKLGQHIYRLEKELDPITISFYEKMLRSLSGIANAAENTGDMLRAMIVKS